MELWAVWLVIVILLTILEFATVNLVSIWFIASGILAMITSLFTDNLLIQFAVFVIFGIIFLLLTKPMLTKMMNRTENKTNLERLIGMKGIVTESIKPNKVGEVKVDGKTWSAISENEIDTEKVIEVDEVSGVKLVVKEDKELNKEESPKEEKTKQKKSKKKESV